MIGKHTFMQEKCTNIFFWVFKCSLSSHLADKSNFLIDNPGNLTKGKPDIIATWYHKIFEGKQWAANKVKRKTFILQRKRMLLLTVGLKPVKRVFCEEMWRDRREKVNVDCRLAVIIKSAALSGEALAESCTTGVWEPEATERSQ